LAEEGGMATKAHDYVPVAGSDWLLVFYDPLCWVSGFGRRLDRLIEEANIQGAMRVMDVGCGTGTLVARLARRSPQAEIIGVDPDPKALAKARRKVAGAGGHVRFLEAYAQNLPAADGSIDRVLSSFMLHHLPLDINRAMIHEVRRVLAPGGSFHLADFMPEAKRADGLIARIMHHDADIQNNTPEQIAALLDEAGFTRVENLGAEKSVFGRVGRFRASA
jgi:SAM-dependent methyltransferase